MFSYANYLNEKIHQITKYKLQMAEQTILYIIMMHYEIVK